MVDPVDVDLGGDERDPDNYASSKKGNFTPLLKKKDNVYIPMIRDDHHVQFWEINRKKKFVIDR